MRREIAISLNILAVPLSLIMQELTRRHDEGLTSIILVVSLVLLADWIGILRRGLRVERVGYALVIAYILLLTFYGWFCNAPMFAESTGFVYLGYAAAFGIALSSNDEVLDTELIAKMITVVTGILVWIFMYVLLSQGRTLSSLRFSTLDYGADRASLSNIPLLFFLGALSCSKDAILKTLTWVCTPVALLTFFACNRRGAYIAAIIGLILRLVLLRDGGRILHAKGKPSIGHVAMTAIALVLTLLIISFFFPSMWETIVAYMQDGLKSLTQALRTLAGLDESGDVSSQSAIIRANSRRWAWGVLKNSSIFQLLLGHGYNYAWIDLPVLQALVDMGIVGFVPWAAVTVYYPLHTCLTNARYGRSMLFFTLYYANRLLAFFYSGTCYGLVFIPILLVLYQGTELRRPTTRMLAGNRWAET